MAVLGGHKCRQFFVDNECNFGSYPLIFWQKKALKVESLRPNMAVEALIVLSSMQHKHQNMKKKQSPRRTLK
jgi:hypothetical protein